MKSSLKIDPKVFTFPRCDPIVQARNPVHKKSNTSLLLYRDNVFIFMIRLVDLLHATSLQCDHIPFLLVRDD